MKAANVDDKSSAAGTIKVRIVQASLCGESQADDAFHLISYFATSSSKQSLASDIAGDLLGHHLVAVDILLAVPPLLHELEQVGLQVRLRYIQEVVVHQKLLEFQGNLDGHNIGDLQRIDELLFSAHLASHEILCSQKLSDPV